MTDTLFGMQVIENPLIKPQPVLQVSPDFEWITPAQRAKTNAWLLETFGTREVMYVIDTAGLDWPEWPGVRRGKSVLMHPKQAALLRMNVNYSKGEQDLACAAHRAMPANADQLDALRYAMEGVFATTAPAGQSTFTLADLQRTMAEVERLTGRKRKQPEPPVFKAPGVLRWPES